MITLSVFANRSWEGALRLFPHGKETNDMPPGAFFARNTGDDGGM